MRKSKSLAILFAMILFSGTFPLTADAISAKSGILMEQSTGRVLYEKNANVKMRIASITKIMTAILAIESGELREVVTVSEAAASTEGSSIYLKPGQKIKLIDLTYGLMLRSGNDSAVAIAEHVGGSLGSFVKLMNKKATEIGMDNTVFSNPHGLDDHENHFSTAYDMALLTRYAMRNPIYKEIASTKKYIYEPKDSPKQIWTNKNKLLTQLYSYSTGGKTGYTIRAKRTLVSTVSKDNLNLISVTINDPNDWQDHITLFENAFNEYKLVEIIKKGDLFSRNVMLAEGLIIKHNLVYPLSDNEVKNIIISIEMKNADRGNQRNSKKPVGKLKVFLNKEQIGETPIFNDNY